MSHVKRVIGITYGDAAGIGPELVSKALQSKAVRAMATWVLIGDERIFIQGQQTAKATYEYRKIEHPADIDEADAIYMIDTKNQSPAEVTVGQMSADSGKRCGENLITALDLAKAGQLEAIVYAPLNKEAMHRGGLEYYDEIHFFASQLGCTDGFSELNAMDDLWVARVTSHIALRNVSDLITQERVAATIRFAYRTLQAVGIEQPRIGVMALNPHAGEGGLFGTEEIEEIVPAIREVEQEGVHVEGPFPADTFFLRLENNRYDCVVGMYHDQVQTGMKLLGFHKGVTISGGLPVTLTTPAHGTAFDIAGRGIANPGAMTSAMELAVRLAARK